MAISEKLWPLKENQKTHELEKPMDFKLRWQRAWDLAKQHLEERKQMSGDPASQWPNMARKAMNIPYISMDWFKGKLSGTSIVKKWEDPMVSGEDFPLNPSIEDQDIWMRKPFGVQSCPSNIVHLPDMV